MHSALFSLNHAIIRLDEKALGSGGKSEDLPFSETAECSRCKGVRRNNYFCGIMKHESIVVVYDSCRVVKTLIIMYYVLIIALEFILTIIGVAMLVKYYNHKA
jgi:hypothetical protein